MIRALLDFFRRVLLIGRGRAAAVFILVWLLLVNLASDVDWGVHKPPLVAHWVGDILGGPFKVGQEALFDSYQRIYPRSPQATPVTIVAIDEASLKQLGQWPWPRNRTAALINAIAAHQPAAIGLDMYMPEADATSPASVADNLTPGNDTLSTALRRLPGHDTQLAGALRNAPTVLGAAGFDFQTFSTSAGLRTLPLQIIGEQDPLPFIRNYPWVLASLPELQAAATGQAVLSVQTRGGLVRRMPLVMAVNGQSVPSLAIEILRVATGAPAAQVFTDSVGVRHVTVADLTVPTQANGEIWLHFAKASAGVARNVSAASVLAGKADPDLLKGKLVLVGLTGTGLSDQRTTALGELVPGIEIQAQLIETLFEGRMLLRPWWMKWVEFIFIAGFGALLIWKIPSKGDPLHLHLKTQTLTWKWLTLALNVVMTLIGYAAFVYGGYLFDASAGLIALSSVVGSLMASGLIETNQSNAAMAAEQQRMREVESAAAAERSSAWRIQLGSLPKAELFLRNEARVDLATMLIPAKDVGGDLFDFFMIDTQRLGFVIGDVSGKGLPASLFMAITQTLTRTIAKHVDAGPICVAKLANAELAHMNPEALFVTLLVGVFDLQSGQLTLVNAGHDGPWWVRKNAALTHLVSPESAGGPPLCVVDDFPYTAQHVQLEPGDTLVMYTDGITEAMNPQHEIYGGVRLQAALQDVCGLTVNGLVEGIKADVSRHVAGMEPSDDITMLVIRWTPTKVNAD
jgi:adenylate cyclase